MHEMHGEMHFGFDVKHTLLLSNFNQNGNVLAAFRETPQYQIS
jgi:hypothetical protein